MYSILVSKIVKGMKLVNDEVQKLVKTDSKVVILPWAFPSELDSDKLINQYFKKGGEKYNKYVNVLLDLGINEDNIFIGNCYSDSKEKLQNKIKNADILLLPGGNPEMLYSKVVQETEILYDIKYFDGLIIGESAGAVLHQKRYFITEKNNYYKYFAFYDGFGIINDPFYVDVHSSNDLSYLNKLECVCKDKNKDIYAIFDEGAIILNRVNNEVKMYGNVIKIDKKFN